MVSRDREQAAQAIVGRRLGESVGGRTLPPDLLQLIARVFGPWLCERDLVKRHPTRCTLAPEAKDVLENLRLALFRMEHERNHHGQQAFKKAQKTLRAIRANKLTAEEILNGTKEFQKLRMRARTNADERPFADAMQVQLGGGIMARRLITRADLARVGGAMGNCLARENFRLSYVAQARDGAIELVALYDESGQPIVLLRIDTEEGCVAEIKGCGNSAPRQHRSAIAAFLAHARRGCDDCFDATDLAICEALLGAEATTFTIDGTTIEVAPGALAVCRGDNTALVRLCRSVPPVRLTIGTDGDEDAVRSKLRSWLRRACKTDAGLRAALDDAFECRDVTRKEHWKFIVE